MAVAPPLVYVDQAVSIIRKRFVCTPSGHHSLACSLTFELRDSTGFSRDVCAILYERHVPVVTAVD